jgi:hypothetical protein
MLARSQSRLLLALLTAFFLAAGTQARAQVNGVPASVTSFGFGGRNNPVPGVRASVTSLGPNGSGNNWTLLGNCCSNFFLPLNHYHGVDSERHRRRRDRDDFGIGVIEPVYIPYAVSYAPDADDEAADDEAANDGYVAYPDPAARNSNTFPKRASGRDSGANSGPLAEPQPVAAQPSTVLVFKDGHQSDVVNYAIVGDTLFDFSAGRTRKIQLADLDLTATQKANDDRGVDFAIPVATSLQ